MVAEGIVVVRVRHHSKASEAYLDVRFALPGNRDWAGSIPVTYRRTGLDAQTAEECLPILQEVFAAFEPASLRAWEASARQLWDDLRKQKTRKFFDVLLDNVGRWVCQGHQLPQNPNWARRVQDIKELGFTLATDTSMQCKRCGERRTHLMLLPVRVGPHSGYELLSGPLRRRIIRALGSRDAYEGKEVAAASLLPDHKFPEIRWDENTRVDNPSEMTEAEIRRKFQLLTNQRNQQKREVCRACLQTGRRGSPFGVEFFYDGGPMWPSGVPKRGAAAEAGCIGCGWYDFEAWRKALASKLQG